MSCLGLRFVIIADLPLSLDIIVTQTASKQYLGFIYKQVRKKTHLGSTNTIWFTHLARKAKP